MGCFVSKDQSVKPLEPREVKSNIGLGEKTTKYITTYDLDIKRGYLPPSREKYTKLVKSQQKSKDGNRLQIPELRMRQFNLNGNQEQILQPPPFIKRIESKAQLNEKELQSLQQKKRFIQQIDNTHPKLFVKMQSENYKTSASEKKIIKAYSQVLIDIAKALSNQGKHKQSLVLFQKIITMMNKTDEQQNDNIIEAKRNIAWISILYRDYAKAIEYYDSCLKYQEKNRRTDSQTYLSTLNGLANAYYQSKNYTQALNHFIKCQAILQKKSDCQTLEYARFLNSIGMTENKLGHYPLSLKNFQRCLNIQYKILGSDDIALVSTLGNIGNVYFNMSDYQSSIQRYLQCINLSLINEDPTIEQANAYYCLGSSYTKLQRYEQAMKNYEIALKMFANLDAGFYLDTLYKMWNCAKLMNGDQNNEYLQIVKGIEEMTK